MNECPWYTNDCERYDCCECELYNIEEGNKEEENKGKRK